MSIKEREKTLFFNFKNLFSLSFQTCLQTTRISFPTRVIFFTRTKHVSHFMQYHHCSKKSHVTIFPSVDSFFMFRLVLSWKTKIKIQSIVLDLFFVYLFLYIYSKIDECIVASPIQISDNSVEFTSNRHVFISSLLIKD